MQNIFLIGLSGSGKSTVGRLLADRLGRTLIDTDMLIEELSGERIPALFARYGEEYFRSIESRALTQAIQGSDGAIIATGGGIVLHPENRLLLSTQGICIFLATRPLTAFQRLKAQAAAALERDEAFERRPLLETSDPLSRLEELLSERLAWYQQADIIVETDDRSHEQVTSVALATLIGLGQLTGIPSSVRHVHVGAGYDTVVDWGGLGRLGAYLTALKAPERLFFVSDSHVYALYGPSLTRSLQQAGYKPNFYVVPAGEASKSQAQLGAIYDWLLEQRVERSEMLLALGGGVVGDLTGFAAATYLRGIPLIQLPTSLLAQVDAAIGGKTGINHPRGKNLIGAFYQPRLVLVDPASLLTLPVRERTEGWAEIVKYGMILDAELFALLEAHTTTLRTFLRPSATLLCQIIARCIALKAEIVEEDEREQGRRAILNYGHTLGHALENVAGYGEWLHGEAVSLGMVAAAMLAQQAGLLAESIAQRQSGLLRDLGLPTEYHGTVSLQALLEAIQLDKKVASKRVRWVLPQQIGEVTVTPLPDELVQSVVAAFFGEKRS